MLEIIFGVEEAPDGGYIARASGEAIFTEADTWEELRQSVREAVACHLMIMRRGLFACVPYGKRSCRHKTPL